MKRRRVLQSALAWGSLTGRHLRTGEPPAPPAREYYELRRYHLRRGPNPKRFEDYVREAVIPARNRLGIGPIGVFHVTVGTDYPGVYVRIPYQSLGDCATAAARLQVDAEYQRAQSEFINCPPTDPVYVRVQSSLRVAFEGMLRLEVPALASAQQPRLFERRTGLTPVFFGETPVGDRLPNLTSLLVVESMAARDKNWATFAADLEWKNSAPRPGTRTRKSLRISRMVCCARRPVLKSAPSTAGRSSGPHP